MIEGLPSWAHTLRPHQADAIDRVLAEYRAGNDLVVLDGPTGSGKTLIAEAVRLSLGASAAYVPHTITLQHQFVKDFDAALLMGRSNYPIPNSLGLDLTAADCVGKGCTLCPTSCPYIDARDSAFDSDLATLNTMYWLTQVNSRARFKFDRPLVVFDEADTLEAELMRYVSVYLSKRRLADLGLTPIGYGGITKPDAWARWVEAALPAIQPALDRLPPVSGHSKTATSVRRARASLHELRAKLVMLAMELEDGGWVYTGKDGAVEFKPVRVDKLGPRYIWAHGGKFLLMSATVVSPDELVQSLGWEGRFGYVQVPSSFPVERRPVCIVPAVDMSKKAVEANANSIPLLADTIARIWQRHDRTPTLVHTVSYDLASKLCAYLPDALTYRTSPERATALADFRQQGGILLAPSLDRGVDLPDDSCRVIVVAKMPYPYLGDRQVSARLHDGRTGQFWYNVQTVRTLVQMTGRAMRHKDDSCTGYILDQGFLTLWKRAQGLFPDWWVQALDWRTRL